MSLIINREVVRGFLRMGNSSNRMVCQKVVSINYNIPLIGGK